MPNQTLLEECAETDAKTRCSEALKILATEQHVGIAHELFTAHPYRADMNVVDYANGFCKALCSKLRNVGIKVQHNSKRVTLYKEALIESLEIMRDRQPPIEDAPPLDSYAEDAPPLEEALKEKLSWIELQRFLFKKHGIPAEYAEDPRNYCILPEDTESVVKSKGIYVSRKEHFAFTKFRATVEVIRKESKKNKDGSIDLFSEEKLEKELITITVAKILFPVIPETVYKTIIPEMSKGQGTIYTLIVGGEKYQASYEDIKQNNYGDKISEHLGLTNMALGSQMAPIIDHLSEYVPQVTGRNRTGIHQIDGVYGYLYKNGFFLSDKEPRRSVVFTEVVTEEKRRALDRYLAVARNWDSAKVQDSLHYAKNLSPIKQQNLITLSHVAASVAMHIRSEKLRLGHVLLILGPAGSAKTSQACYAGKLMKPTCYDASEEYDATGGTALSREKYVHQNGDTFCLLDDIEASLNTTRNTALDAMDTLAKRAYNGLPIRTRGEKDLTDRASFFCNSMPVFTGVDMPKISDGSERRTLIMQIERGDFNLDEGDFNMVDAYNLHSDGFSMIGYKLALAHCIQLNELGMEVYADKRYVIYKSLRMRFKKALLQMWKASGEDALPQQADNLVSIGGTILLGAHDIDAVTENVEEVLETIFNPLVKVVFDQINFVRGQRVIEGKKVFAYLLQEMFGRIAESRIVCNKYMHVNDVTTGNTLKVSFDDKGKLVVIHDGHFQSKKDDGRTESVCVMYGKFVEGKVLEGCMYLTPAGKAMLLLIAKDIEEVKHVESVKALSSLAQAEGFLSKSGDGRHADVFFTPKGMAQQRGLMLKMSEVLPLVYDWTQVEEPVQEVKSSTPTSTPYPKDDDAFGDTLKARKSLLSVKPSTNGVAKATQEKKPDA